MSRNIAKIPTDTNHYRSLVVGSMQLGTSMVVKQALLTCPALELVQQASRLQGISARFLTD